MASVSTSTDISTAPDRVWDLVIGTRFTYENEFAPPGGAVGDAAGSVAASRAGNEADASLQRLEQLAEA